MAEKPKKMVAKTAPKPIAKPAAKKPAVPYGDGENAANLNKVMDMRKAAGTMKKGGKIKKK
jgi:hypothetical protein